MLTFAVLLNTKMLINMARNNNLKDKVILVAGGAKNLGGLLSHNLAVKGAKIAVHYNSPGTKADAEATLSDIKKAGGEAIIKQADLTVIKNIARIFDEAIAAFGGVDIAINTVGKVLKKPIAETTEEEYDSMSDINAKIAYFFIQEAGKKLNDNGKICRLPGKNSRDRNKTGIRHRFQSEYSSTSIKSSSDNLLIPRY